MNFRNAKFKCENWKDYDYEITGRNVEDYVILFLFVLRKIMFGKADTKSYWQILLTVSAYAV